MMNIRGKIVLWVIVTIWHQNVKSNVIGFGLYLIVTSR